MNILIIGGSSGLGLALATKLAKDNMVFVTGRTNPQIATVSFIDFPLTDNLESNIAKTLTDLPNIDVLIYAAGFYQEGTITELSVDQIHDMLHVGLLAPMLIVRSLLEKQVLLNGFIAITSTSQWIPRLKEPIYTAVKAGLAMFANSLSLDARVKKTLVAAPAGMKTPFWENTTKDTADMLVPEWVADQILDQWADQFIYKYVQINRNPNRVEIKETR